MMPTRRLLLAVCAVLIASTPARAAGFTLFESGHVRPLALSPDGLQLFAVNTPDNRLEIFDITPAGLTPAGSVTVGLEPVAVAARSATEVWVVNHLSDSISIVDVSGAAPRVVRTLLVGDEPRDIVFAGPARDRAFITAAHRGQNRPGDPQLTTPGIGRADVWVFNANDLGTRLGGTPLAILTLFTDTPRALAVSPNGQRVYAAGFHTGNRTTTVFEGLVPDGGPANGGLPNPRRDAAGELQPETGLIVRHNGQHWVDELGRTWDTKVRFALPDRDVFTIDATTTPPQLLGGANVWSGVGTVLFNMAVNPVNGAVYVTNTEAFNEVRFEGAGLRLGGRPTVRGHLHESRITVLTAGGGVAPRHLNKHIDYSTCCAALPNAENAKSLAQPLGMAVSADGGRLFVAAFGSSKIGVFNTAALEADTFAPDAANQIRVSGGGPTGLVLDEPAGRMYVFTRFDNGISIIDLAARRETAHLRMFNPEPASIVRGRPFLYDAALSSSRGDSACGSCHVFGDFDSLAWDLGNPDETTLRNPGPFRLGPFIPGIDPSLSNPHFRALKGPMTTQSLRGMANHGPMHWRGDRTGGNDAVSVQPDGGAFNEDAAFKKFNPAFVGLLGRSAELAPEQMQRFTDFILQITYPPNPIRALDNSLTPAEAAGRRFFFGRRSDTFFNCNGCHVTDPNGNRAFGVAAPGFFGTDGRYSFESEPQFFKIPHLRNMYQKVGMFGMAQASFFRPENNGFMGDQVRGFGFAHDGSVDTLFRFHGAAVFRQTVTNPGGFPFLSPNDPLAPIVNPIGIAQRRQVEQFMFAFDTNLAPVVGQQTTLNAVNAAVVGSRIDLLRARADLGECDLVAHAQFGGEETGFLYLRGHGAFTRDRAGLPAVADASLRASAHAGPVTYTCTPPGSGVRIGLDRDSDGWRDGDERAAGTNPADAASHP